MKINILFIIIIGALFSSCTKTQIYLSKWQYSQVIIDGYDKDWSGKMYYDSNAKMACIISNDENSLYIKLKVVDKITQRKIIGTGFTLWIDTIGKGKKQSGINYPMKANNKIPMQRYNSCIQLGEMILIGFYKSGENIFTNNKMSGSVNVVYRFDSLCTMIYEADIPLRMLFSNYDKFITDTSKVISIGFETGSLDIPLTSTSGRSGGGMGKGGGGKAGGSQGRGRCVGNSALSSQKIAEMQAMSQASKFWIKKVRLSIYEK